MVETGRTTIVLECGHTKRVRLPDTSPSGLVIPDCRFQWFCISCSGWFAKREICTSFSGYTTNPALCRACNAPHSLHAAPPPQEKLINTSVRKSWDAHFMNIAREVASMGTCSRRQVGCVLITSDRRIAATGFNGVPPGWPHCRGEGGKKCPGASAESGSRLDECYANHAEINALLNCADVTNARTCYVTCSPCISCVKALLCTRITTIIFGNDYPHKAAAELWQRHPLIRTTEQVERKWIHFDPKTETSTEYIALI